ncbi:MAG TPA: hypothetical protein VNM22_15975 [Candidatus Limnocylindrales bacterium]|nr:hypothetical protein [Candidatus Limnocylindrales bacterium]
MNRLIIEVKAEIITRSVGVVMLLALYFFRVYKTPQISHCKDQNNTH